MFVFFSKRYLNTRIQIFRLDLNIFGGFNLETAKEFFMYNRIGLPLLEEIF